MIVAAQANQTQMLYSSHTVRRHINIFNSPEIKMSHKTPKEDDVSQPPCCCCCVKEDSDAEAGDDLQEEEVAMPLYASLYHSHRFRRALVPRARTGGLSVSAIEDAVSLVII